MKSVKEDLKSIYRAPTASTELLKKTAADATGHFDEPERIAAYQEEHHYDRTTREQEMRLEKQALALTQTALPKEDSKVTSKFHCGTIVARTAPTPPETGRNKRPPYPEFKWFLTFDSREGLVACVGERAAAAMEADPETSLSCMLQDGKLPADAEERLPSVQRAKNRGKPKTLSSEEIRALSLVASTVTTIRV